MEKCKELTINISRNLNFRKRLRDNLNRNLGYSLVVDYFVIHVNISKLDSLNIDDVIAILLKCTRMKNSDENIEWANTIVMEMLWMGLLTCHKDDSNQKIYLSPTDDLFEVFKNRKFHSNYASFLESRNTKVLSIVSVIISFLALSVSLILVF